MSNSERGGSHSSSLPPLRLLMNPQYQRTNSESFQAHPGTSLAGLSSSQGPQNLGSHSFGNNYMQDRYRAPGREEIRDYSGNDPPMFPGSQAPQWDRYYPPSQPREQPHWQNLIPPHHFQEPSHQLAPSRPIPIHPQTVQPSPSNYGQSFHPSPRFLPMEQHPEPAQYIMPDPNLGNYPYEHHVQGIPRYESTIGPDRNYQNFQAPDLGALYRRTGLRARLRVPWTAEDEDLLRRTVARVGKKWKRVAAVLKNRTRDQCRERWRLFQRNEARGKDDDEPEAQATTAEQRSQAVDAGSPGEGSNRPEPSGPGDSRNASVSALLSDRLEGPGSSASSNGSKSQAATGSVGSGTGHRDV
mmetsp:Transcript_8586/g.19762  ORF Transcript_8586/g.19762 Transcript_8586/m.19762 type:complete len:356 (+) Transcript_8586:108-1175(+)